MQNRGDGGSTPPGNIFCLSVIFDLHFESHGYKQQLLFYLVREGRPKVGGATFDTSFLRQKAV